MNTISITGTDIAFDAQPGQSVLEAAEDNGWAIPYSCRKGVCDTCVGVLDSGEASTLGAKGIVCGTGDAVRLCRTVPEGDIAVTPKRIKESAPPKRKRFTTQVFRARKVAPQVTVLELRYPIGRRTPFQAGQFVNIILPDGDTRPYSLANSPVHNDAVQLHIRTEEGGQFSDKILNALKFHDPVEVEGPYGEFFVEDGQEPIILLATGTGFAPMRSIILDHAERRLSRPIHLFWGARNEEELYAGEQLSEWERRFGWFSFTPVISRPDSEWHGAGGWVQDAVLAAYPDLSEFSIYACGSERMIESASAAFTTARGLDPEKFHADAFVPATGTVVIG
ncbi:2Fe-2S iron-sulfur cluster-binding protein [Glutamicibacter mysorens]|uniref:2Fe-2S iron-sulfur cluster-binding protein n=1 Tax=Glutamicibacter mysorens TaxID=257984 RepID=UPI0020C663D8|nr:2Fe-2S iron-sulfur cluster-binding protein [Glutamicibacter mysorens]UTM45750.1 2Fe-2S iron-sulfur cluster-binding protein [Glutamicibacter mysorens]